MRRERWKLCRKVRIFYCVQLWFNKKLKAEVSLYLIHPRTISDLVGEVEKRTRKPWITQEMISKMDERRKWKNVNTEKGRRNYRRLRNELKRATEKAKKEYLENACTEIMEFQRTGRYDLMYMKTKELGRRPKGFKILTSKTPREIE